MKKIIFLLLSLWSFTSGYAEYSADYYSAMNGKRREALKAAAKECVGEHQQLVYLDLPNYWQYSDVYPEKYNGQTRWWEMYSNEIFLIRNGQSTKSSFSANHMNREHSVPKSWWKYSGDVEYTPAYSDMWNLYPSDGEANMAKSNYPLGIVAGTPSYDNGCTKVGTPAYGYGGGAGKVFEPDDEYKGDFARGYFYMATVYDNIYWLSKYGCMFSRNSYPTLLPWAYEMLLEWHRKDPVSQKEILRNDAVEKSQGNRNPFVDFPQLAEYIWGEKTSETFYINEQPSPSDPPITGNPELTLPINGETLDFGQVAEGSSQTSWIVFKGKNFTSPISLTIGGVDRKMFELPYTTISASAINSTGEYLLPVIYTPGSTGSHTATLSVFDGGLPSSLRVNLKGEGCELPQLTTLTAYPPANVTDNSYTACWEAAPEVVDYYILYRTRYLEDGYETEELESATNSLEITGRDVAVAESYKVASSRLGFLSAVSNTIIVEASGVNDVSADSPITLGWMKGGFTLLTSLPIVKELNIYDMTGRLIASPANLTHGDVVELNKGVYIIKAKEYPYPFKYIVE